MKYFLFFLMTVLLLESCNSTKDEKSSSINETKNESQKPTLDLSTPDMAVESYHKYNDWQNNNYRTLYKDYLKSLGELYEPVLLKAVRDSSFNNALNSKLTKEQFMIDKVEIQSDTRAIVLEKNLTFGTNYYRYTLTKHNNNWYIRRIEDRCYICDGEGKMTYSGRCEYCKGTGWTDVINFNI